MSRMEPNNRRTEVSSNLRYAGLLLRNSPLQPRAHQGPQRTALGRPESSPSLPLLSDPLYLWPLPHSVTPSPIRVLSLSHLTLQLPIRTLKPSDGGGATGRRPGRMGKRQRARRGAVMRLLRAAVARARARHARWLRRAAAPRRGRGRGRGMLGGCTVRLLHGATVVPARAGASGSGAVREQDGHATMEMD